MRGYRFVDGAKALYEAELGLARQLGDPNYVDEGSGKALIYRALETRNAHEVEHLLLWGADPNLRWRGFTPMSYAMELNEHASVYTLLEAGAHLGGKSPKPGWQWIVDMHAAYSKWTDRGWSPETHAQFPGRVRRVIFGLLLCRRRKGWALSGMPRGVLHLICWAVADVDQMTFREWVRTQKKVISEQAAEKG